MSVAETSFSETLSEITSEAELREVLGGYPSGRSVTKERTSLHPLQIEWLKASPFCVLATCDADGKCDASPETWRPDALPTTAALCKAVQPAEETLEELEEYYSPENYGKKLY